MGAMDARRLELYELLKPKLDSEPARQLVLALGPAPDMLATRDEMNAGFGRVWDEFTRVGDEFARVRKEVSAQIQASEERLGAKIETTAARLEAAFTRRMVTILGAWTILVGSTVGWIFTLAR